MATYKTPGVYVQEVSLFPPSVAEVATAIPAFIGYTDFAKDDKGNDLTLVPTKIKSLLEFELYFGAGYNPLTYNVYVNASPVVVDSVKPDARFYLYDSLRLFFDNGGGECYIVSVDNYTNGNAGIKQDKLVAGLNALTKYDEPTLILFPDAIGITGDDRFELLGGLQQQALNQCAKLQDRFTVMDVMDGFLPSTPSFDPFTNFRQNVGMNNLSYGAAYYPWVKANFLPEIEWSQLKFMQKGTETAFSFVSSTFPDSLYKDYFTKKDNQAAINLKINTIANNVSGDIIAYLASVRVEMDAAATDNDKKPFLSKYFKALSDMAVYFPELLNSTGASDDLKNVLSVLKNEKTMQGLLIELIKCHKYQKVIERISENAAAVKNTYKSPFFDPPTDWVCKYTFDAPEMAGLLDEYAEGEQGKVVDYLNSKKIPEKLVAALKKILEESTGLLSLAEKSLVANHPFFKTSADKIKDFVRLLPPSGAMVGLYAMVDRTRGVWKAPANVSVSSIVGPAVKIDNKDQENLNVHATGKSINAIRAFTGKGTLVWGARTLAGNDNEWRYIPVRRFYNMVEESVKKASEPFTFENNDKTTWVKVRAMIENYLTLQWRAGALQGAKPEDAFFVRVGLGETMTSLDILEGRMIVEIGMAVVRPAEFIILRFSHKMIEK